MLSGIFRTPSTGHDGEGCSEDAHDALDVLLLATTSDGHSAAWYAALMEFIMGAVLGWLVTFLVMRRRRQGAPPPAAPRRQAPRSTGIGRAALRSYRLYGDARSIARGTYGKRLLRRSAFRTLRKL